MPLVGVAVKWLSVPPATSMLAGPKVVLASLRVKVMVSLLVSVPLPLRLMATVGEVVSVATGRMVRLTLLLTSLPSAFWLPAASLNLPEATLMTPLPLPPVLGMKVAV